ncbi:hypothetical protein IJT17_03425 [bacterium]|nr:hypothetical protein [bacterium]
MSDKGSRFYGVLLALIAVGLLAAISVMWERHELERTNRTAVLLSDYRSLCDYARQQGLELDAVLKKAKSLGVSALAVDEMTRDDLQNGGLARVASSYDIEDLQYQGRVSSAFVPQAKYVYFVASDSRVAADIASYASESLGSHRAMVVDPDNHVVALEADLRQVGLMGFGVPTDTVDGLVKKYGFRVWVRPWNSPFFDEDSLHRVIAKLARPGVDGVIFGGLRNEVLGFPNYLDMVGKALNQAQLKIGVIELPRQVQQKGIQTLARNWQDDVVRVQSVPAAQQAKLHPLVVAAMYGLGARERNIRLMYVRPYADGFDRLSAAEATEMLYSAVASDMDGRLGATPTVFSPLPCTGSGLTGFNFRLLFIAIGIAAAWCSLARAAIGWYPRLAGFAVLFCAAVTLVAVITGIGLAQWRLLLALLGLMVFPVWGMVLLFPVMEKYVVCTRLWQTVYAGWKIICIAGAFSLVGGIMGASCLPDAVYMLSIDVFRGVKLHSLMVPLLTLAGWVVFQNRRGSLSWVRRLLKTEVQFWHLAVLALLAGAGAFYLVRTGNAGGDLVVSETERELRRWLDMVLGVRPRFKEFVLGNPVLLCIPTLIMCRWRGILPFAVLAAAVGEASLAGTYAHLHTPIVISLWRSCLGLIIGGVLGTALSWLIFVAHRAWKRYVHPWLASLERDDFEADSSAG